MKIAKTIYIFILLLLVPVIILHSYFTNNTIHKDTIIAEDYFGKYTLVIPISVSNAHSYEFNPPHPKRLKETIFYSSVSLSDLYEIINKKKDQILLNDEPPNDYNVDISQSNNSINLKLTKEDKIIYFSIVKVVSASTSYYRFFNMGFDFYEEKVEPYDLYKAEVVLLPIFLIDDQRIVGEICFFDTDYKISCYPEQFIEFYKEISAFDIEFDEDGYVLKLESKFKQTKPLKLFLSSINNENFFRITQVD
ncbi:MAG: hypothetical protein NC238_10000 [Dehalobacter sp.]|nr:hypothetical protein [Dehalobacter sp.]